MSHHAQSPGGAICIEKDKDATSVRNREIQFPIAVPVPRQDPADGTRGRKARKRRESSISFPRHHQEVGRASIAEDDVQLPIPCEISGYHREAEEGRTGKRDRGLEGADPAASQERQAEVGIEVRCQQVGIPVSGEIPRDESEGVGVQQIVRGRSECPVAVAEKNRHSRIRILRGGNVEFPVAAQVLDDKAAERQAGTGTKADSARKGAVSKAVENTDLPNARNHQVRDTISVQVPGPEIVRRKVQVLHRQGTRPSCSVAKKDPQFTARREEPDRRYGNHVHLAVAAKIGRHDGSDIRRSVIRIAWLETTRSVSEPDRDTGAARNQVRLSVTVEIRFRQSGRAGGKRRRSFEGSIWPAAKERHRIGVKVDDRSVRNAVTIEIGREKSTGRGTRNVRPRRQKTSRAV